MATYSSPSSSTGGDSAPQSIYFITQSNSNNNLSLTSPEQCFVTDMEILNITPGPTNNSPILRFIEQPTNKYRFRYRSEMAGTHGSLCGLNSDKSRKQTYPTVELRNFNGKAVIRCSLYQYNVRNNAMPHPHRLIMKKGKDDYDDPHEISVGPEEGYIATFHSMGIIHTARKNLVSELIKKKSYLKKESILANELRRRDLTMKELIEIQELAEQESKTVNLNIVCLRFDAFFINEFEIPTPICPPLFSHGINNLKCALTGDLKIVRMDHCTSSVKGGREIFLLVERVTKKNIKIRFFEMDEDEQEVWEGWGRFSELDVHHQYAIVFKSPPYDGDQDVTGPVKVFMELVRPSDGARSEPKLFRYVPDTDCKIGSKRPRSDYDISCEINDNIPTTIPNNFYSPPQNLPTGNSWNLSDQLTFEQINQAISDYNSEDFDYIFSKIEPHYTDDLVATEDNNLLRIDSGLKKVNLQTSCTEAKDDGNSQDSSRIIKLEVSKADAEKAQRTYHELKSFIKSDDASQRAPQILEYYLGNDRNGPKNNAIHIFISLNRHDELSFILKMLILSKKCELINVINVDRLTPLHIAVKCHNELFVSYLLRCKADSTKMDGHGRTVLHTAIKSMCSESLLKKLISPSENPKAKKLIELENYEGASSLNYAVENHSMRAVKVLCRFGADVNRKHHKNGFTPLRIAIENRFYEAVEFILNQPQFNMDIQNDFQEISPSQASLNSSEDIREAINKYLVEHGKAVELKSEVCDDDLEVDYTDIMTEQEEQVYIKSEQSEEDISSVVANLEAFYNELPQKKILAEYLEEIALILDAGDKYKDLAELLDLNHLLLTGAIKNSKTLLQYAVEIADVNILDIRNFLEVLDEHEAVAVMDRMAKKLHQ